MYAIDYANRNFNYVYEGNYNKIYLFNDEKPVKFKVESPDNSFEYYVPVVISEDNEDYVLPLINDPANATLIDNPGEDIVGFANTLIDSENPQILTFSTAKYLLEQGYLKDTGIEKKLANPNDEDEFDYIPKNLFLFGSVYYVLGGEGFDLDEVVLEGLESQTPIKPFIDFDDALDKEDNQLIVMVSSDGAKIDDAYLSVNKVNSNEIVLFIETMEGSNFFGSSVRVRTGSNVNQISGSQRRTIKKLLKAMELDIDEPKIVRILKKHVQNTSDNPIVYYIKKGFLGVNSIIPITLGLPLSILGLTGDTIADAIEKDIRLGENRWRYYTKEGEINKDRDLFLPIDWLVDAITEFSSNENLKNTTKGWLSAIEGKANEILQWLKAEISGLDPDISKYLNGFIEMLSKGFKNLIKALKEGIKNIADFTIDRLLFLNGLVVGIINSVLDTIAFIFKAIGFLFNPKTQRENVKNLLNETGATTSFFLEILENGLDIIRKIFSVKTLNAIILFEIQVAVLLYQSVTNTDPKKALNFNLPKADAVGYFIGFIVGFIIEEIITAMLTAGTLNVAKASQLALKSMKETLQAVKKLPGKIATKLGNIAQRGTTQVVLLISNVRKLVDDIPQILDHLYKWLKKLLSEAKQLLDDAFNSLFAKTTNGRKDRSYLEKRGYKPTKYEDDILTICPIGI